MNKPKKPSWYILGAGAIGCLWAAYLRQAGFPVVLIAKKPNAQTTLTLNNVSGKHQFSVIYKTTKQLSEKIDYLLLSTKAQQTEQALTEIKAHLSHQASVLVLQNGLASELLPQHLPTQKLFAAVTTDGAYRTEAHTVTHAGIGKTLIGPLDPTTKNTCTALIQQLPLAFLSIECCHDIKQQQWKKLAINCVINGLTAIYQCRNGELLTINQASQQLNALCEETFTIIDALGVSIGDSAQTLYNDVHSACTTTANNYSSMYQDIKHKRPTEIDFINGYLCTLAKKNALNCPENTHILKSIKQLEQ
ncbi:MAG: 2-dehydropantoate 2-reductase, partial [Spongiibacteraceae bacterium]|nr:2-dehydropantoate 2-reductase [Spongiibacteraceae bacterium]